MSLFCVIFFSSWLKGIIYAFIDFLSSRNNAVKNFFVFFYYYCVLCFCYCKRSIYLEQFYNLFSFFVLLVCFSFTLAVCSKSLVFFIQTVLLLQRFLFTQQFRGNSRNLARVPTIQIICTYVRHRQQICNAVETTMH